MAKLPIVSGSKVIQALQKIGFEIVGQKGSHVRLKKKTSKETRIVPSSCNGLFDWICG